MKIFEKDIVYGLKDHEFSLGGERQSFTQHQAKNNTPLAFSSNFGEEFLEKLEKSGLTGHGGAHFPVSRKLSSAIQSPPGGTVVANGAEGEPGSAKDAALWQFAPHLILDGLAIAGALIRATRLIIWIHEEEKTSLKSINKALQERVAAGKGLHVEILTMPNRYTSGENSSVVAGVQGKGIAPVFTLDKARPWGANSPAILSHNTETLGRIAMLYHHGVDATSNHLLTVIGDGKRTVREANKNDSYAKMIGEIEGAPPVLFGGYSASWLPWESVHHLRCDPSTLRSTGLSFGAGIIAPLPDEYCPIVETGRILVWMADQSARQCGPCFNGLADLALRWSALAQCQISQTEFTEMTLRLGLIPGRGGCSHPDGTVRMARSAVTLFANEVESHIEGKCTRAQSDGYFPVPEKVI